MIGINGKENVNTHSYSQWNWCEENSFNYQEKIKTFKNQSGKIYS